MSDINSYLRTIDDIEIRDIADRERKRFVPMSGVSGDDAALSTFTVVVHARHKNQSTCVFA